MKKKKNTIEIKLPVAVKFHHHNLLIFGTRELVYDSKVTGQKIPPRDVISQSKQGMIDHVFFDKDHPSPTIHINCTIGDLKRFVTYCEARVKKLGRCWNHLNPELTFLVSPNRRKNK